MELKRLNMYLSKRLDSQLNEAATKKGVSKSAFVRKAVTNYLDAPSTTEVPEIGGMTMAQFAKELVAAGINKEKAIVAAHVIEQIILQHRQNKILKSVN